MGSRVGLWARLTNAQRSIHVASGDWEMILMRHGNLAPASDDRWSAENGTWQWTAEEARALLDALIAAGGKQCAGLLMIDTTMGGGAIRGTSQEIVADGLTPEQRTAKLIQFLEQGPFRWKFITGPIQVFTGGAGG